MDNQIQKAGQQTLSISQEKGLERFKSEARIAIKIEHGINGTSLVRVKNEIGEPLTITFIADLIMKQSLFFNLIDNITKNQSFEIAELMLNTHPNVTVSDIIVCFRYAKTGKPGYEKPMSRLDGRVIFSWMNTYLEEKLIRIEELNRIESDSHKNEKFTEGGAKVLETISNSIKQKEQREKQAVETKTRMTAEKHEKYLRENISHFSRKEKEGLIKQFESRNRFGSYNDIINFLKENL